MSTVMMMMAMMMTMMMTRMMLLLMLKGKVMSIITMGMSSMITISVISTLLMFIDTMAKIFTTYCRKVRNGQKYVCDTQRPPFQYLPRNAY